MPLPKKLARFNRSVTNRLMLLLAGWAPGFAVLHHAGRKSGTPYTTPVWALRRANTLTIALVYGPDSDWTKNILAANGCEAEYGRQMLVLGQPRIVHDPTHNQAPAAARPLLRLLNVSDALELAILGKQTPR
jgi:deazaflavin-dependent oxidoreductase (nitroreductase family)